MARHTFDYELPDGWTMTGGLVMLRCLDADGRRVVQSVYVGDCMWWEAVGLAEVARSDLEAERRARDDAPARDAGHG